MEAAGIGQNRFVPTDEVVQAAELFDDFEAGAQPEVIGVAEDEFGR